MSTPSSWPDGRARARAEGGAGGDDDDDGAGDGDGDGDAGDLVAGDGSLTVHCCSCSIILTSLAMSRACEEVHCMRELC